MVSNCAHSHWSNYVNTGGNACTAGLAARLLLILHELGASKKRSRPLPGWILSLSLSRSFLPCRHTNTESAGISNRETRTGTTSSEPTQQENARLKVLNH